VHPSLITYATGGRRHRAWRCLLHGRLHALDANSKKEIAHERLHRAEERRTFTTQQVECQAEATAYGVCAALAIPTPNTPTYLALYKVSRATLATNLDAIRAGVAAIMGEIAPLIEPASAAA